MAERLPPVPYSAKLINELGLLSTMWSDWFKHAFIRMGGHQAPQFAVQDVISQTGAVATGTTTIPFDDTIPQNTEGTEFLTCSITPRVSSNRLTIEAVVHLASNTADRYLIAALFQDSSVNALAATSQWCPAADGTTILMLRHEMEAGTTSSTTFRIRAGAESSATVTFNGAGGSRRFGGVSVSSLRVTERVI